MLTYFSPQKKMSDVERENLDLVVTFSPNTEISILNNLIKGGVFSENSRTWLRIMQDGIRLEPDSYVKQAQEFFRKENLDQKLNVEFYVARVLSEVPFVPKGHGFNLLFSDRDPNYARVRSMYREQCKNLKVEEIVLPFNILWGESFYLRKRKYERGWMGPLPNVWQDEVFDCWEKIINKVKYGRAAYFRLGLPTAGIRDSDLALPE